MSHSSSHTHTHTHNTEIHLDINICVYVRVCESKYDVICVGVFFLYVREYFVFSQQNVFDKYDFWKEDFSFLFDYVEYKRVSLKR